jgi:hypothetical protein
MACSEHEPQTTIFGPNCSNRLSSCSKTLWTATLPSVPEKEIPISQAPVAGWKAFSRSRPFGALDTRLVCTWIGLPGSSQDCQRMAADLLFAA